MNTGEYVLVEFNAHDVQAAVVTQTDEKADLVEVDNKRLVPHVVKWVPTSKCKPVCESTLRELGLL